MTFSIIFPIVALVVGWGLNELSRYFLNRHETHGAIGKTLLNLLTIRNSMAMIKYFSNYVVNTFSEPQSKIPEIKIFFRKMFLFNDESYKNIKDSITSIAFSDPVLALKLQVSVLGTNISDKLSSMVEGNAKEDQLFLEFLSNMEDKLLPNIDSTVLYLAKKHGIFTYFRVKSLLHEKIVIDQDSENTLKEFKKQLDEIKKV